MRDNDSGLDSVTVHGVAAYHNHSLHVDPFTAGTNSTVTGRYEATCCEVKLTIVVKDMFGNLGHCIIDMAPDQPSSAMAASRYGSLHGLVLITAAASVHFIALIPIWLLR